MAGVTATEAGEDVVFEVKAKEEVRAAEQPVEMVSFYASLMHSSSPFASRWVVELEVETKEVNQLLQHVANGEQDKAEALIRQNRNLKGSQPLNTWCGEWIGQWLRCWRSTCLLKAGAIQKELYPHDAALEESWSKIREQQLLRPARVLAKEKELPRDDAALQRLLKIREQSSWIA